MQTVKNETTVENLVFEGLPLTSIPPLISIFNAKDLVENFLSQCRKMSLGNTLLLFQNFLANRNTFCIRKGYHYFPLKFFCLTVPKNFVGAPPCLSQNLGYRKIFCMRGISRFSVRRGVAQISVDYFMSHSAETFVGEPFSVSLNSVIEKFYEQSLYHDFASKFFCIT